MDFTVFSIILNHHFPGLCDPENPRSDRPYRIFSALDQDKDGFLNYAEVGGCATDVVAMWLWLTAFVGAVSLCWEYTACCAEVRRSDSACCSG